MFVEVVKSEKDYTTARPAPLKDVLVTRAGIDAVIGCCSPYKFSRKCAKRRGDMRNLYNG